jgi:hypothetical protein
VAAATVAPAAAAVEELVRTIGALSYLGGPAVPIQLRPPSRGQPQNLFLEPLAFVCIAVETTSARLGPRASGSSTSSVIVAPILGEDINEARFSRTTALAMDSLPALAPPATIPYVWFRAPSVPSLGSIRSASMLSPRELLNTLLMEPFGFSRDPLSFAASPFGFGPSPIHPASQSFRRHFPGATYSSSALVRRAIISNMLSQLKSRFDLSAICRRSERG